MVSLQAAFAPRFWPLSAVILLMAARTSVMGDFVLSGRLKVVGWLTTLVMALSVIGMVVMWPANS